MDTEVLALTSRVWRKTFCLFFFQSDSKVMGGEDLVSREKDLKKQTKHRNSFRSTQSIC